MTVAGIVILSNQLSNALFSYGNSSDKGTGAGIVTVVGIGAALGSIPFFISSGKNARRAAAISFKNQKILFPQQNTFILKTQPTLTLKIGL